MNKVATVVTSTRNRKDDLRVALASCLRQTADVEILVMDDASDDGTYEMLLSEFPSVRVVRSTHRLGQSEQRTRAMELVETEFFISIDDDVEFTSDTIVARTLEEFSFPSIAIVAMPFININNGGEKFHFAPEPDGCYVTNSFVAAAFAARTKVLKEFGLYRKMFLHRHEEEDLSFRLLQGGYFIRLGNADPLYHFVSPRRDRREIRFLDHRNLILMAWFNFPSRFLLREVVSYMFRALRDCKAAERDWLVPVKGIATGFLVALRNWAMRRPISVHTMRLCYEINRVGGAMKIDVARSFLAQGNH